MRTRLGCGLLLFLVLLLPAQSAGRGPSNLDRLLPEIRRHTPGTLYDARGPFFGPDQRARYLIKWMTTDGRILWFEVDASNGHILRLLPTVPGRAYGGNRGYPPDRWEGNEDEGGPGGYPPSPAARRGGAPQREAPPPGRSGSRPRGDAPSGRGERQRDDRPRDHHDGDKPPRH